MMTLLIFSL